MLLRGHTLHLFHQALFLECSEFILELYRFRKYQLGRRINAQNLVIDNGFHWVITVAKTIKWDILAIFIC